MILGGDTITVINNGAVTGYDGLGTATYAPDVTVVTGCSVQEHQSRRDLTNITDVEYGRFRVFAPPDAPLRGTSLVVIGDVGWPPPEGTLIWQSDSEPMIWRSRHGTAHHLECYLREQIG
jgi:hypothetical protein